MYIGKKLIYLQLQKTGCTHIADLLSKMIPGKQVGKHNWLKNYNTDKFIIGSIRNPLDWYVSLWAYGCSKKGALFNNLTNRKYSMLSSFKEFIVSGNLFFTEFINEFIKSYNSWNETYEDYNDANNFRLWLKLMYNSERKIDLGEKYYSSSISNFAGFMTYRYCKLHMKDFFKKICFKDIKTYDELLKYDKNNNILDYVIRNESLGNDLIKALEFAGYNITDTIINLIMDSEKQKKNVSKHRDINFYYDSETKKLVLKREKFIIEKYNYKI